MSDHTELLDALEAIAAYHERMQLLRGTHYPFHLMAEAQIEKAIYTLIKLLALADN